MDLPDGKVYIELPKPEYWQRDLRVVVDITNSSLAPKVYDFDCGVLSIILSSSIMQIPDLEARNSSVVISGDIQEPGQYLEITEILRKYIPTQLESE